MKNTAALMTFGLALAGCPAPGPSYSPAPLQGGETITYRISTANSAANATITFEKTDPGFIINSAAPAYKPQRVGDDLQAGRSPIQGYDLGMVWLPPEVRSVGSKTFLGDIIEEKKHDRWTVFVMSERNGQVVRYFDTNTGFLVYIRRTESSNAFAAHLQKTSIDGL